ncbi:MAG: DcaP family trimeric outer membrane transporter [Woeseiaceae bacterium]
MKKRFEPRLARPASFAACLVGTSMAFAANADEAPHHEAQSQPETHKTAEVPAEKPAPKALEINAGGVSLQFGGFVKLDMMQDLDPIGNENQFKVNSIPVSTSSSSQQGGSNHFTVDATRFTLDVHGTEGPATGIRAYVEGDFYGSGNSFRIRHAYGEWNGLLAGQTWSTFQDISARPFTLDYEGPDGEIFVRQPMIRYTRQVSSAMQWAVAVEEADSQITVTGGANGSGRSELPDITGNLRLTNSLGHIQVGGLVRQLRYVSSDGSVDETTAGYGLNLSGSANVLGGDAIMGQVAFGSGMSRYIEAFSGTNSDAVITAANDLEALDAWTVVLGYTHHWNSKFNSTISAAVSELDDIATQPGSAIKSIEAAYLNLVYKPFSQFMVGGEFMWGERENFNGDTGDAVRLQLSMQYSFQ